MSQEPWVDQEILIIKLGWTAGESAEELRRQLLSFGHTRSRSAILGKLKRLGLMGQGEPSRRRGAPQHPFKSKNVSRETY